MQGAQSIILRRPSVGVGFPSSCHSGITRSRQHTRCHSGGMRNVGSGKKASVLASGGAASIVGIPNGEPCLLFGIGNRVQTSMFRHPGDHCLGRFREQVPLPLFARAEFRETWKVSSERHAPQIFHQNGYFFADARKNSRVLSLGNLNPGAVGQWRESTTHVHQMVRFNVPFAMSFAISRCTGAAQQGFWITISGGTGTKAKRTARYLSDGTCHPRNSYRNQRMWNLGIRTPWGRRGSW